ncbi:hypothetical protein KEM60_02587 [Austwickia sp. TVS 96-490-7B]|uniref:hypothetical protein n=1 Tax=Austwickia sp. TVS 96-490-7B TaxID=2830843 RepID=UPI001C57EBF9|nr:hypothetical protein [Austwickia sp. TVS 96-490-7B]MBW3086370.1 hypothetical protein [Austwickia sp. TVS 96-490-7B]
MITRDLLVEALSHPDDSGTPGLDPEVASRVADSCLAIFASEAGEIRRQILQVAAERISPAEDQQVFAGAPWDMGFHDGRADAAHALRLMSRQL